MIYFIRDPASGLVKIGTSFQPTHRLEQLRATHPLARIEATAPGDRYVEYALHAIFIADHAEGEWFRPSPRMEAAIIAINEGWFRPQTLPKVVSPLRRAAALKSHETRRRNIARRAA